MNNKPFEEPTIEAIHFNSQDLIATSTCGEDVPCSVHGSIPIGPPIGCQSAADAMIIG